MNVAFRAPYTFPCIVESSTTTSKYSPIISKNPKNNSTVQPFGPRLLALSKPSRTFSICSRETGLATKAPSYVVKKLGYSLITLNWLTIERFLGSLYTY